MSIEPLIGSQKRSASSVLCRQIDSLLCCCLPSLCVGLVTYSSFQALRNAHEDPGTAAFAVGAGTILLLLWLCFHLFEKLPREPSAARDSLKLVIWILCVLLNLVFTLRVTLVLDSFALSCFVWGVAGATTLLGAYLVFFCSAPQSTAASSTAEVTLLHPVPADRV